MKKNIKEAIKEHLYANEFAADPNNPGFVDRFIEHTKAAEWVQTGASIACGMMQKNVRKGKEIILLNAKMVDLT